MTAEGLLRADLIRPTTDPQQMLVCQDPTRYIPEVFYVHNNEFGTQVKEAAKPTFPVEYLLVSLTHGYPIAEKADGCVFAQSAFPSPIPGHEDICQRAFAQLQSAAGSVEASFNLAVYAQMRKPSSRDLFDTSAKPIRLLLAPFSLSTSAMQVDSNDDEQSDEADFVNVGDKWQCPHCTFVQASTSDSCEMCSLPRTF